MRVTGRIVLGEFYGELDYVLEGKASLIELAAPVRTPFRLCLSAIALGVLGLSTTAPGEHEPKKRRTIVVAWLIPLWFGIGFLVSQTVIWCYI